MITVRKLQPSGLYRRIVQQKSTDVSQEPITSVFRVEKYPSRKSEINSLLLVVCFLFGLLFDSEDGGDTLLRNICGLLLNYTFVTTVLCLWTPSIVLMMVTTRSHCCENPKSNRIKTRPIHAYPASPALFRDQRDECTE
jgi:hypothetical protein